MVDRSQTPPFAKPEEPQNTKKTGAQAGFFRGSKTAESRYPARDERRSGRRAREVIPAAMRAVVRISASGRSSSMRPSLALLTPMRRKARKPATSFSDSREEKEQQHDAPAVVKAEASIRWCDGELR